MTEVFMYTNTWGIATNLQVDKGKFANLDTKEYRN